MAKLIEINGKYCESDYENAFIGLLEKEGWQYTSGADIKRNTNRDVLNIDDLKNFLSKTNPDLTANDITNAINKVRLIGGESEFTTLHKIYKLMVSDENLLITRDNQSQMKEGVLISEHPLFNAYTIDKEEKSICVFRSLF